MKRYLVANFLGGKYRREIGNKGYEDLVKGNLDVYKKEIIKEMRKDNYSDVIPLDYSIVEE